jgi:hypothetical protein
MVVLSFSIFVQKEREEEDNKSELSQKGMTSLCSVFYSL